MTPPRGRGWSGWRILFPVVAALAWAGPVDGAPPEEIRWFELRIDGETCGWMRLRDDADQEGRRTVEEEMSFRLGRGGAETVVRAKYVQTTDADGSMLEMSRTDWQGGDPVETSWTFAGDRVLERRVLGGRIETRAHPRPEGDWIAASLLVREAGRDPSATSQRTYRVIGPATGLQPVSRRLRPVASGPASPPHRCWEIIEPDAPPTITTVDERDRLVHARTPMGPGLGDFEMVLVDHDRIEAIRDARFELDERGEVVPWIAPSVGRPDRGSSLVVRLRVPEGPLPEMPDVGGQRVVVDGDAMEISIDVDRGSPVSDALDRWLVGTPTLETDDPEIVRFARRSAPSGLDDWSTALRLRRAVHRHIRDKSYAIGFATAAQTVRSRKGDCTEHALLLAASLRVRGLPSRLVTGLTWTPSPTSRRGRFVWHMWVQVAIDGAWRDLDPTIEDDVHQVPSSLAVTTSDGSDRALRREESRILELFGRGMELSIVRRSGEEAMP